MYSVHFSYVCKHMCSHKTCTHSHSHTLSLTHSLARSYTHMHACTHTHTHTQSLTHTHTHTHTLSLSVSEMHQASLASMKSINITKMMCHTDAEIVMEKTTDPQGRVGAVWSTQPLHLAPLQLSAYLVIQAFGAVEDHALFAHGLKHKTQY